MPPSQKALSEKHIKGEVLEVTRASGLVQILNSFTLMKVYLALPKFYSICYGTCGHLPWPRLECPLPLVLLFSSYPNPAGI